MARIRFEPFENFAVAFPGCQLFEQGRRLEAEEVDDVLIERRVVITSPFFPARVARPLSSMRGRIT